MWTFEEEKVEVERCDQMDQESWNLYWVEWGNYICSVTWLEKYGDFMKPEDRVTIELQRETLDSQPITLIDYSDTTESGSQVYGNVLWE